MVAFTCAVALDRERRWQLFTHLLVFQLSPGLLPSTSEEQVKKALLLEVTYRMKEACFDERAQVPFALTHQEQQALCKALQTLQQLYEQTEKSEVRAFALEHLSACLALVAAAAPQTQSGQQHEED